MVAAMYYNLSKGWPISTVVGLDGGRDEKLPVGYDLNSLRRSSSASGRQTVISAIAALLD